MGNDYFFLNCLKDLLEISKRLDELESRIKKQSELIDKLEKKLGDRNIEGSISDWPQHSCCTCYHFPFKKNYNDDEDVYCSTSNKFIFGHTVMGEACKHYVDSSIQHPKEKE